MLDGLVVHQRQPRSHTFDLPVLKSSAETAVRLGCQPCSRAMTERTCPCTLTALITVRYGLRLPKHFPGSHS